MNVKIIKLLNGEELISEVIETEEVTDHIKLKNPATIRVQQTAPGQFQIGLGPFMPTAEEERNDRVIELNRIAVVATANPKRDILNEYNKIFGSNIVLADLGKGVPGNLHV